MRDDRPVGTIAVVDTGRPSPHRINAAACKVAEEMGNHAPLVEIRGDDEMMGKMGLILAALEANGIRTVPPPPVKQPKRRVPNEEQQRRLTAAEAKRQRRREKRARDMAK